ncbi:hypothetical protein JB92DRAFT_3098532 [Gautieria morchelliformis]|nr:hypothetical protein JB92DRAFT_3098532 [Gautieria morchelliformis]
MVMCDIVDLTFGDAGLRSTGCREGRGRRSGSGGGSGSEATRTGQDGGLLVKGIYRSAGHAPLSMGHGLVGVCELVRADVDEGERRSSLGELESVAWGSKGQPGGRRFERGGSSVVEVVVSAWGYGGGER